MKALEFEYFINETYETYSRGKKLTLEETIRIFNEKCKMYDNNSVKLFRGTDSAMLYSLYEPKKFERVSANTANYYTVLIDEILPNWKSYPKRSKSLVCSTSEGYSGQYGGYLYEVIPFDNAKIGVCPYRDIWESFTFLRDSVNRLEDFNSYFYDYIIRPSRPGISPLDARNIGSEELLKIILSTKPEDLHKFLDEFKIPQEKRKKLHPFLREYLDPKRNGFQLFKNETFKGLDLSNNEVWTDGPCLLIRKGTPSYWDFRKAISQ